MQCPKCHTKAFKQLEGEGELCMICGKFIPEQIIPMHFDPMPPMAQYLGRSGRPKAECNNPNSQRMVRLTRNKECERLVFDHFQLVHGILTTNYGKLNHVVAELAKVDTVPVNSHRLILKYYRQKHESMIGGVQ